MAALSECTSFIHEPPIVEIADEIAVFRYRSGNPPERAMSLRNLTRISERIQKALRQHAAGDKHVIIDD